MGSRGGGSEPFDVGSELDSCFRFNRFTRYKNAATSAATTARRPSKNPVTKAKPANETISGKLQSVLLFNFNSRERVS